MKYAAAVIDTNIVVAAPLTVNVDSPTARILDGMCGGVFPFLLSSALLAEHREVLLRKKLRALHGLSEREIDSLLTALVVHAIIREPETRGGAPDANDDHVWSLVQSEPNCVLVTGDHALIDHPPSGSMAVTPRQFVETLAK